MLQALRHANENLVYADLRFPGGRAKTINEICYADDVGEMQFLRKTLLSGAFKFDQQSSQRGSPVWAEKEDLSLQCPASERQSPGP